MVTIFLCHSTKDKPFVRELSARLQTYGVKVWMDEAEIRVGDSLIERIGDALETVDYVAAVLSLNSIQSEWVGRELRIALHREFEEKKVVVLPILLHKVRMPPFLREKLYADFSEPSSFEESFRMILRALGVSQEHLLLLQNHNFQFHSLHHFLDIDDAQGHHASWRKETVVTPLRAGIDFWRDEQFHSTGNLQFVGTHPGIISERSRDGGTLSVITRFPQPLVPRRRIKKILEIEAIDCLLGSEEDFSWVLQGQFEEFGIHIRVPKMRPFRVIPRAFYMLSTQECEIPTLSVSRKMDTVEFVVRPPIQGAKYVVRWHW